MKVETRGSDARNALMRLMKYMLGVPARAQLTSIGALRGYGLGLVCAALALIHTSCTSLTKIDAPDLTGPGVFNTPQGAAARRTAALSRFASGFSSQVLGSGIVSDEFSDRSGGSHPEDRRIIFADQAQPSYPYATLIMARLDALRAIPTLQRNSPDSTTQIAQMFAYVGFVDMFLAEDLCSGVPLASIVDGVPANARAYSRDGLLAQALADFDSAAHYATTVDSVRFLAAVGRGRALLDSGVFAAAAAAVNGVPASFVYVPTIDGVAAPNGVSTDMAQFFASSVSDREGQNGLAFITGHDPRVHVDSIGSGVGGPIYEYTPYAALTSTIVLASGTEASLIRAEAALQSGQIQAWTDTLNALRATFPDTALSNHPLPTDSTTAGDARQQALTLFHERAFWLFATGHRQGELRRLARQYGFGVSSVFPTGSYQNGLAAYGTDVTYTPVGEGPLVHYSGCADRSP